MIRHVELLIVLKQCSGAQVRQTGDSFPGRLFTYVFVVLLTLRAHQGDGQYPFTDIAIECTTMIPPDVARAGKSL